MRGRIRAWDAIPGVAGLQRPDTLLVLGVGAMLAVLVVPLPGGLLDLGIATNLGVATLLLVTALRAGRTLDLSSFPALLLQTTLLRLCLNVATTRRILGEGDGGQVVEAFGQQVAGADVVLGLVILLILTLVQLLVVGKGAERVAEVGARFALDALPGQQMSIDAELRAGTIEPDAARRRREELAKESQFRGAMDGAMKFVKGDAVCGLLLMALNLLAGSALGVLRDGLALPDAVQHYAILTIGDGLTSQLSALLVALTAGVLATRGPDASSGGLGATLGRELFEGMWGPLWAGAFLVAAGLLTPLPTLPFCLTGLLMTAPAWSQRFSAAGNPATLGPDVTETSLTLTDPQRRDPGSPPSPPSTEGPVPALTLDLDPVLSARRGRGVGQDAQSPLLREDLPAAREQIHEELGIRIPGIHIRSQAPHLDEGEAEFRVRGVPALRVRLPDGRVLALEAADRLARLGVDAQPAEHPLTGGEAAWVLEATGPDLDACGIDVWGPSGVLALYVVRIVRTNATRLVGLQEVADLVRTLEETAPDLVRETVPKAVSLSTLADVVRRLVDERISVRDFKAILESLAEWGPRESDPVVLTEQVRAALGHQIAHLHAGPAGRLPVLCMEPEVEDAVRAAIVRGPQGSQLALDPELRDTILSHVRSLIHPLLQAGIPPVVLTEADIRRYVHKLLEQVFPGMVVLSLQELPGHLVVHPVGRVGAEPLA